MIPPHRTTIFLAIVGFVALCPTGTAAAAHVRPMFPVPIIELGTDPVGIVAADFDSDGIPDVAAIRGVSFGVVSVVKGRGDFTFGSSRSWPVGDGPTDMIARDVNGDSNLDIVVLSGGSNEVTVLLGTGDGEFVPSALPTPLPQTGGSMTAADFDGDGWLDLFVAPNCLLRGIGDGTFAVTCEPREYISTVHSTDLDNDGSADLVGSRPSALVVRKGHRDGTFSAPILSDLQLSPTAVALGDLDSEGGADVVAIDRQTGRVSVAMSRADGTFGADTVVATVDYPWCVRIADFDNDGDGDIAVGGERLTVIAGNGDGTFAPPVSFLSHPFTTMTVFDVDGDGALDVAAARSFDDLAFTFIGRGDGTFSELFEQTLDPRPSGGSIVIGRFNPDEFPDIVSSASGPPPGALFCWLGGGDGAFGAGTSSAPLTAAHRTAVADFDGDAIDDVALIGRTSDRQFAGVLLANGDGSFDALPGFTPSVFLSDIGTGDFDADGRPDLVLVVDRIPPWIGVYLGRGDGTFELPFSYLPHERSSYVAVGDLDEDRHDDIVLYGPGTTQMTILLANPDGTFRTAPPFGSGLWSRELVLGDFNGDGHLDMASTQNGTRLELYTGHGDGTLTHVQYKSTDGRVYWLAVADFDRDGVSDIAATVVDPVRGRIEVFRGDHELGLLDGLPFLGASDYAVPGFAAADVDADGWTDLIGYASNLEIVFNQHGTSNIPPTADAGIDEAIECTGTYGASVTLDGSGSSDEDSTPATHDDIVSFEWIEDLGMPSEEVLGEGEALEVLLPVGQHTVYLRVTDSAGETGVDSVTKIVSDTTAPEVSAVVSPDTLWPPNHRMFLVTATVHAWDLCGSAEVRLESVVSSDPDDGIGDGATVEDIRGATVGTEDYEFRLRAERAGPAQGRHYTVTYMVTDQSGNVAATEVRVSVPASRASGKS